MNNQTAKNLQTLTNVLSIAAKMADEEWNKLTPERKAKIRDNILKRAMKRVEARNSHIDDVSNGTSQCVKEGV